MHNVGDYQFVCCLNKGTSGHLNCKSLCSMVKVFHVPLSLMPLA